MIKITKEKEVNRELLESALTIVIDDDIIKPEIITSEERVVGHHSDYPEVEYYYRDKWFRMTLLPKFFLNEPLLLQQVLYDTKLCLILKIMQVKNNECL